MWFLRQDHEKFIIHLTRDMSLRRKAICHSIPELCGAELRLPAEAKGLIAPILELDPSQSSNVLDEKGVARLPGTQFAPLNQSRNTPAKSRRPLSESFATLSLEDTSTAQTFSANRASSPLGGLFAKSSNVEKETVPQPFAFRGHSPTAAVLRPAKTPSPQDGNTVQNVSREPSPSPLAFSEGLNAAPRDLSFRRSGASSKSYHAKQVSDSLTGPPELLKSIVSDAKKLSSDTLDLICTQTTEVSSSVPNLSKDPLQRYLYTTTGFFGELFVGEAFCICTRNN